MTTAAYDFDVLIVGAGPAGLSAARVAADNNMSVGIVDDNPYPGGQIWRQGPEHRPTGQARDLIGHIDAQPNVTLLNGTRIVQALDRNRFLAENARHSLTLHCEHLILACGARERLLPFPGWTLPGVTGAGGLQALVKAGTPVEGQRIVVAGSGPLLWAAAATAHSHGARIMAIVEQAGTARVAGFAGRLVFTPAKLAQALKLRLGLYKTPYLRGAWVAAAHGDGRLSGVTVHRPNGTMHIACDRLGCGYGLLSNTELAASLGCALRRQNGMLAVEVDAHQATSVAGVHAAGECTGIGGMELSAAEGKIAAHAMLGHTGALHALLRTRARYRRFAAGLDKAFALNPELRSLARPDTCFCRCEDVPYDAVAAHSSWRGAKLQTRCGMGPCQGKICGGAAAFCFGWGPQYDGAPVTPRTPLAPTRIDTLLSDHENARP
jgi:NADPH-dependent 2,4-dienoyl-CoA reductase/sulfur reductase-like enzyme